MKYIHFLLLTTVLSISILSCSKENEDDPTPKPSTTSVFNATIGAEVVSTNNTMLAEVSAGGTQAFTATLTDGRVFSSAIFSNQFPIGEAKNIAYSGSISYKIGNDTYIPKSGTMTLLVMENYKRMKGTFSGVFIGGSPATEIAISGDFDISNP